MRPRTLRFLWFPALGSATAILVAWATTFINADGRLWCTGVALPQPSAVVRISGPGYDIQALLRGLDADPLTQSPALGPAGGGFTFEGGVSWTGSAAEHSGFRLHDGGRDASSFVDDPVLSPGVNLRATRAAGWPMRCLGSTMVRTDPGLRGRWLIPIAPGWKEGPHLFARSLPVRPIWAGLAANTAIYTGVWWLVLGLPRLVYGVIRRRALGRKGRCKRCGYDLSGLASSVCPECGMPVKVRDDEEVPITRHAHERAGSRVTLPRASSAASPEPPSRPPDPR